MKNLRIVGYIALCLWICLYGITVEAADTDYDAQCANCHGVDGTGGLFAVPVTDDISLAELTHIIDRTMPLGATQNCVDACASDIASYILTNFVDTDSGETDDVSTTIPPVSTMTFEAEDCDFSNSLSPMSDTNASGGIFIDFQSGGNLTCTYNATAGDHSLAFTIKRPSGDTRSMGVFVNGSKIGIVSASANTFTTVTLSGVALNDGNNSIEVRDTEGTSQLDIDKLDIARADGDGDYLYISNRNDDNISIYSINSTGALSSIGQQSATDVGPLASHQTSVDCTPRLCRKMKSPRST